LQTNTKDLSYEKTRSEDSPDPPGGSWYQLCQHVSAIN